MTRALPILRTTTVLPALAALVCLAVPELTQAQALQCFKAATDDLAAPADLRDRYDVDDACGIAPFATHVCVGTGVGGDPAALEQVCYRVTCPGKSENGRRKKHSRSLLCIPAATNMAPASTAQAAAPATTTTLPAATENAPYGCCRASNPQYALCYSLASAGGGAELCRDEFEGEWVPGGECGAQTGGCTESPGIAGPCCQLPDGCQAGPSVDLLACSSGGFGVFFSAQCIEGICVP